jgi:anti-sigma regulatory factor (Ser/Thr protein kinase)
VNVELLGATSQTRHVIDEESRVGEARRQVSTLARSCGLDATATGRVAIAAAELATNLLKHGGGGELLVQPVRCNGIDLIELIAIDRGKGMSDLDRCLSDGYSTSGSAGTGLGAVQRLASEFDTYSVVGHGTVIMARVGAAVPRGVGAARAGKRFGAINVAVAGETECGDKWRLAKGDGLTSLMVADGLGHGMLAAKAAERCVEAFETSPFDMPRQVIERAHRAAQGSRGAAAACARVTDDGHVTYAGVGNISACIVSPESSHGMVSHGGTLGLQAGRMHEFQYQRKPGAMTIMHSDGISARWNLRERAGLMQRHPGIIAAILYRDHGRGRDDSTVVVVE